jgi:hypothetical protein
MKVAIGTWEVPDEIRRAIRHRVGKKGLATREEIRADVDSIVAAVWDDYVFDLNRDSASGRHVDTRRECDR